MSRAYSVTVHDWRAGFGVVNPERMETIPYMLWDRQTYTSAATTNITFFTQRPATRFAGNLALAGQLPADNYFLIMALRCIPLVDTRQTAAADAAAGTIAASLTDMKMLLEEAVCTLRIGEKEYCRWPLIVIPAGCGVQGLLSVPGTFVAGQLSVNDMANNGNQDARNAYTFPVYLVIPEQFNFSITLEWNGAQTLVTGDAEIIFALDGELMRPSQ